MLTRLASLMLCLLLILMQSMIVKCSSPSTPPEDNNDPEKQTLKSNQIPDLIYDNNNSDLVNEVDLKAWQKAFSEIRTLVAPINRTEQNITRVEIINRYANEWELKLNQWAEDVSVYMKNISKMSSNAMGTDGDASYDFGRYGLPRNESFESSMGATAQPQQENSIQLPPSPSAEPVETANNNSDSKKTIAPPLLNLMENAQPKPAADEKSKRRTPEVTLSFPITPRPAKPNEPLLPQTDISDPNKHIWIITTASLPWMTGTAVNPLLRASYLTNERINHDGMVTLMLPWMERSEDQEAIYGSKNRFANEKEQEEYVRNWLREEAKMEDAAKELRIRWYVAWQEKAENSVYSMGDITALIPQDEADIIVLEEPEHLNWYRAPGESWTNKFKHVVGVVHTNYFVYAQEQSAALIRAPAMRLLCSWMCRAHCHRVIKLSATLGSFAPEKELVENVHGVRQTFLDVGDQVSHRITTNHQDDIFGSNAPPTVYFIGKMLWSKGLATLMDLMKYAQESAGLNVKVDMYGGGPDKDEAMERSNQMELDMPYHGPVDHAKLGFSHKIFVNPSTSEVLCTTAAEALAMGKFVVLPSHPSNDFFTQFPNCLPYSSKEEFVGNLYYALTHSPEPLSEEFSYALSWEAATRRFEAAGTITVAEAEALNETLSTENAGVEVTLPPLIESEKSRSKVTATLRLTRSRYRQFRSRLSQEIQQQRLLPEDLQQRLVAELDKRLNLDLDDVVGGSPKLKVKLSPAELDAQLLDLYNTVVQGPGGDLLRIIGGGTNVGAQNYYLKRKQFLQENSATVVPKWMPKYKDIDGSSSVIPPLSMMTGGGGDNSSNSITHRIRKALKRNIPNSNDNSTRPRLVSTDANPFDESSKSREAAPKSAITTTTSSLGPSSNTMRTNRDDNKNDGPLQMSIISSSLSKRGGIHHYNTQMTNNQNNQKRNFLFGKQAAVMGWQSSPTFSCYTTNSFVSSSFIPKSSLPLRILI